jgi:DNA-binding NarL/FixJ family response regulator
VVRSAFVVGAPLARPSPETRSSSCTRSLTFLRGGHTDGDAGHHLARRAAAVPAASAAAGVGAAATHDVSDAAGQLGSFPISMVCPKFSVRWGATPSPVAFVTGVGTAGCHRESELAGGSLGRTADMATRILVLVIEDNRLVREGLVAVLGAQPDFKVVAAAEGVNAGLLKIRESKPHVVLVDAALGNHDSHRLVETVRKESAESKVIVMDLLPAHEDVIAFIRDGASGFIVKDATIEEFVRTIRSVAGGEQVVPPALTGTLLSHIVDQAVTRGTASVIEAVRMTPRERGITELIAEGLSNKEIAQRLNIATYTVKSHVHNILEKLALHSRLQIAAHAYNAGAPQSVPPPPSRSGSPTPE